MGKNGRFPNKNIQNYTFGGKTSIKGNPLEKSIKKELDLENTENNTFYSKDISSMKHERVGTSHFSKRL